MTEKCGPAPAIRIAVGLVGTSDAIGTRLVSLIRTRTPGIVITPAQNAWGWVSFDYGCNLTHAPSGFRLAGTFQDLRVARLVAAAVGGIMDWNGRELTDYRAVVVSARAALKKSPALLDWLAAINSWEIQTSTNPGGER